MDNFFEVKNVDFIIDGKTKVKNMSFSIEKEGDIVCLLGPSGIGKTTILRAIAGLQKIKNGHIKLKGKVLASDKINIEPENRNISLAFQENSLFPHYTVEKNILLGEEKNADNKIFFRYFLPIEYVIFRCRITCCTFILVYFRQILHCNY